MSRDTITVIVTKVHGNRAVHFTSGKLQGDNVWFPIQQENSLFQGVERILVTNGIAHNVSFMTRMRETPLSEDWEITFNTPRAA